MTRVNSSKLIEILGDQEQIIRMQSQMIEELSKKNAELENLISALMDES